MSFLSPLCLGCDLKAEVESRLFRVAKHFLLPSYETLRAFAETVDTPRCVLSSLSGRPFSATSDAVRYAPCWRVHPQVFTLVFRISGEHSPRSASPICEGVRVSTHLRTWLRSFSSSGERESFAHVTASHNNKLVLYRRTYAYIYGLQRVLFPFCVVGSCVALSA